MVRRQELNITKKMITWVLVADGGQAQVFVRHPVERRIPMTTTGLQRHYETSIVKELTPIKDMTWIAEDAGEYEVGRKKMGRVFESRSSTRHMHEPHVDINEQIKQRFMKYVAERINKAMEEKAFDRLILVAPARMLGELRRNLSPDVQASIVSEIPKDMTHYENRTLWNHLKHIA